MKKFFIIFVIFALVFLVGCGNNKNKEESEKTDSRDTEAVTDQEPAESVDCEVVTDSDATDTGNTEVVPDTDPTEIEDNDPGNVTQDGCTIKSSFGTHSAKRDIADTCIKEIAKADGAQCSWKRNDESETARHIARLQRLKITFGKECKDKSGEQTVECPNFIPKSLNLTQLTGCDVYSIDPDSACMAACADLYFSTGNNTFHTVYVGDEYGGYPFIKSSDSIKEASLFTYIIFGSSYALFSWSEKGADSTETEKEALVNIRIIDPVTGEGEEEEVPDEDTSPTQCVDNKGKTHDEGDKVPDECRTATCMNGQWHSDAVECYNGCWGKEAGDTMKWLCDDGVTEVDWCICNEIWDDDGVSFTLGWGCYERVDLQCPGS